MKDEVRGRIDEIKNLIFDFDGVIVQTIDSYRRNIIKVVDYYFLDILGLDGESGFLVDSTDIQKFKDTGLFNNDWDLTYALILYSLSALFRRLVEVNAQKKVRNKIINLRFYNLERLLQGLREVGKEVRASGLTIEDVISDKESNELGIDLFINSFKRGGINHIRSVVMNFFPEPRRENFRLALRMVPYSNDEGDFLKRLFEESYLGEELFQRFYGERPFFRFKEGFMEKERFIPKPEVLQALVEKTGKISIYSERSRTQALYHLERNQAMNYFRTEGLIFNEDISKRERELRASGKKVTLGKPDPTLFIELVNKCACSGYTAYVGDSVSDILTVKNSCRRGLKNVYFFGVLSSSQDKARIANRYMELGADVISYDVNELATIFEG